MRKNRINNRRLSFRQAFSLVEMLVSMAILSIIMVSAATILKTTQEVWTTSWERTSQFRDARLAFEQISRNLSQSTLNTYWDYDYSGSKSTTGVPGEYRRDSELHFFSDDTARFMEDRKAVTHAVFFQATLGYTRDESYERLDGLLNGLGYFVEYADDEYGKPKFLIARERGKISKWRFRLMEFQSPTEFNTVYEADEAGGDSAAKIREWFSAEQIAAYKRPLVDNVIALIISPQLSQVPGTPPSTALRIAPLYRYDSRNASNPDTLNVLPPLVKITLVAIDEAAAIRLEASADQGSPPRLVSPQWFKEAKNYEKDLQALEQSLTDRGLNHRVFSATVAIRSAKWST
ncbi:Verru_Chthon cassette protein C [Verrucomicrobiales bacterium BCK34]|nr:Verru_Chthon cassette protein C [Verrucomicrobiales bacterium BCK34]